MIRMIPATRAIAVASALVIAAAGLASAAETTTTETTTTTTAAKPFEPTIYFGGGIGYAHQDAGSDFGWTVQALARPIRNLGIQIEYFNLGRSKFSGGDTDGGYFGLMPILPFMDRLSGFAQVGLAVGGNGEDFGAGGGLLYDLPIAFLNDNKVDLTLRLDYKYLNIEDGDHLLTLGVLVGFHK